MMGFLILAVFYPFLFQNHNLSNDFLKQGQTESEGITFFSYCTDRFTWILFDYSFLFPVLIQILLNYHLKSCNSLTWALILWSISQYSIDNFLLIITNSWVEIIYLLKEGSLYLNCRNMYRDINMAEDIIWK